MFGLQEKKIKKKDEAANFLNKFTILQTTQRTAEMLASIKYTYDKKGVVVSLADWLIATLVIENNAILVTKDSDFNKIEELKTIFLS